MYKVSEENEKVDDVMENTEKDMKEDLTREMQAEAEETEADLIRNSEFLIRN